MSFRNLDTDGDWTFGKGKNNYVTENREIGLNIKTRLASWVGDCFFARNSGIDWLNRLGNKEQQGLLAADLRRIILQTAGVTSLKSIDVVYSRNNRAFTANYTVLTIYSTEYIDSFKIGV